MDNQFTHFDEHGNAIMIDVSHKNESQRIAVAVAVVNMSKETLNLIQNQKMKKGDVLNVARVAGIMAIKQTASLIPMCHPLLISGSKIDFEVDDIHSKIKIICTVKITGQTGVEMEALTGASIAALTIYDMCKAVDKRIVIEQTHLLKKTGGKSGEFNF